MLGAIFAYLPCTDTLGVLLRVSRRTRDCALALGEMGGASKGTASRIQEM